MKISTSKNVVKNHNNTAINQNGLLWHFLLRQPLTLQIDYFRLSVGNCATLSRNAPEYKLFSGTI